MAQTFHMCRFQVGTSVTNGTPNCVVWAGIHHKTSTGAGLQMTLKTKKKDDLFSILNIYSL